MTSPVKLNLKIYQGSTFEQILRWESATKVYVPITNITKSAPVVITAANHNIPIGWRTKITNVAGMREINSDEIYHVVTGTTSDTITLNQVNSLGYTAYTSGGVLEYNMPADLTGYTARMQIRERVSSSTFIHELTTENSGIILDNQFKTIALRIPDSITQTFNFTQAVYSLELLYPANVITFAQGAVVLIKEVTR